MAKSRVLASACVLVDGTDLFGDCTALKMTCSRDGACFKVACRNTAAECGADFACTFIEYKGVSCRPLCESATCLGGTTCRLSDNGLSARTSRPTRRVCTTN